METTHPSKTRERTWLWLYKIVAGVLIVFLLGLHFIVNHLIAPNGLLSWEEVVAYYQNPIIPIIEIVFLVVVISHALIGLRSIILDLNPSVKLLRRLDVFFVLLGIVSSVYGIWLVTVIIAFGRP
jgi:succinate dehydrogenase / fumarate reductase membrane anchor subunit